MGNKPKDITPCPGCAKGVVSGGDRTANGDQEGVRSQREGVRFDLCYIGK
ncbi:MAG: hypothetical protein EBE86_006530 [Hormoscilla sp. GUM202]|nr:hypothetical protein [Hormoscilla sp. GUM202]